MKTRAFLDENFLLHNEVARELYHDVAKSLPIYDYHSHLCVKDIAENRQYENLTQLWLEGDHYKWRIMRATGVDEQVITGPASEKDKYLAWASTVPKCIGNPAFHWTHMELKRPFGISGEMLSERNAEAVWQHTCEQLTQPEFSAQGILQQMNVAVLGTTDDPIDSLEYHQALKQTPCATRVLPSFRPDRLFKLDDVAFKDYIHALERASDTDIHSIFSLLSALEKRLDDFNRLGCETADHGLETVRFAQPPSPSALDQIVLDALLGKPITRLQQDQFFTYVMLWLAKQYHQRGWAMQLHIGPLRNTRTRMLDARGKDAGCDSIGDDAFARPLALLLDAMDSDNALPKTILYHINPSANEVLATMAGNFQDGSCAGKMQFGSAWWFNDQKDGMQRQLEQLAQLGVLSEFVGMLTDSRSLLSFSRHEYFRRILCNKVGTWVEQGEAPYDATWLKNLIEKICFTNAQRYFTKALPQALNTD